MGSDDGTPLFHKERNLQMCEAILYAGKLPQGYDSNRMTLLYFTLMGGAMSAPDAASPVASIFPGETGAARRQRIIEWIYAQQLPAEAGGGFRSTHTMGDGWGAEGHVTMTQCALLSLLFLGDDLGRVDADATAAHIRSLQKPDGAVCCVAYGESDMRFLYSACIVAALLRRPDCVNRDTAVRYIQRCARYDGGIGCNPGCEGHGGTTFCGIASLHLLGCLDTSTIDLRRCRKWLVSRATPAGFNGRPNKDADTCYTYWVGSALCLVNAALQGGEVGQRAEVPLETPGLVGFVSGCECETGGIAKDLDSYPDILHTALPLMGLSNLGAVDSLPSLSLPLGMLEGSVAGFGIIPETAVA